MPLIRSGLAVASLALLAAGATAAGVVAAQQASPNAGLVTTTLRDAAGVKIADIAFREGAGKTITVTLSGRGLRPGYHGFHVHAVGRCDGAGFLSAKGHLKQAGEDHGQHKGDFPPLLVKRNGTTTARFTTDRFTLRALRDADGSAAMIHADPDNFANIPKDRYSPDPDKKTRDTGDSGDRVACGVISG